MVLYGIPKELEDIISFDEYGAVLKPEATEKQKEIYKEWRKNMEKSIIYYHTSNVNKWSIFINRHLTF